VSGARAAVALSILTVVGCQAIAGLGDFAPDDGGGAAGGPGEGGGGASASAGGAAPGATTAVTGASAGTGATSSTGSTSTGSGPGGCGPDHLLVAEVRTRGPGDGNQDFIELLNPTDRTIVLDGSYRVVVRGEGASGYTDRWTGDGSLSIGPGERLLLANAQDDNPLGDATPDAVYGSGISDGASVVLHRGDAVVDAVCFVCGEGAALGDGYVCEGAPLVRPPACDEAGDRSVQRRSAAGVDGCADSDDNSADLEDASPSTPSGLGA
jgi:hypothetical protein